MEEHRCEEGNQLQLIKTAEVDGISLSISEGGKGNTGLYQCQKCKQIWLATQFPHSPPVAQFQYLPLNEGIEVRVSQVKEEGR